MACSINMFNNEPRISFSNDFGDPQQPTKLENSYREAPVSSDFAFSAPSYTMISADELFCKGKMVPLKENGGKISTLRDELLLSGDDDDFVAKAGGARPWKERFGLKRSHHHHHHHHHVVVAKKSADKRGGSGSLGSIDELKIQDIIHDDDFVGF
ncbi:hypothetical protein C2S51_011073 [Perilla frutescens var. frutescens]|nr:hypothetical protein C2S51_011073 [Perilla frutescens var. frutescens]